MCNCRCPLRPSYNNMRAEKNCAGRHYCLTLPPTLSTATAATGCDMPAAHHRHVTNYNLHLSTIEHNENYAHYRSIIDAELQQQ